MGRKIPGKKHRGVRDPEKQRAARLAKIKDKINTAPKDPDEQQIPSSLTRLVELKNKVKQGLFSRKKSEKKNNENNNNSKNIKSFKGKPEKPIPKFEQLPGESDREFKRRMNRICSEVVREAAFEDKYNVDIKRNEKGEVEGVVKRPKDELELLIKKEQKEKKLKKRKGKAAKQSKDEDKQPRLTKSQKWALKKLEKKRKRKSENEQDRNLVPQKENLKFGEIAHAPPSLVVPRRGIGTQGAPRPGQKELLLKSMLTNSQNTPAASHKKLNDPKENGTSKTSKIIDKKGKRKELPHALRRQLDTQQKEIIKAYKMLKLKKRSTGEIG